MRFPTLLGQVWNFTFSNNLDSCEALKFFSLGLGKVIEIHFYGDRSAELDSMVRAGNEPSALVSPSGNIARFERIVGDSRRFSRGVGSFPSCPPHESGDDGINAERAERPFFYAKSFLIPLTFLSGFSFFIWGWSWWTSVT